MPALSFNKKCHHNINVVTALFNNIYALNLFLVLFANQQRASITGSSKLRCYERLKHRKQEKTAYRIHCKWYYQPVNDSRH